MTRLEVETDPYPASLEKNPTLEGIVKVWVVPDETIVNVSVAVEVAKV